MEKEDLLFYYEYEQFYAMTKKLDAFRCFVRKLLEGIFHKMDLVILVKLIEYS